MYTYRFDIYHEEGERSFYFQHEKKYTEQEWESLCLSATKDAYFESLESLNLIGVDTDDGDFDLIGVKLCADGMYRPLENILWTDAACHAQNIIKHLVAKGFKSAVENIEANCGIHEYNFFFEKLKKDAIGLLRKRGVPEIPGAEEAILRSVAELPPSKDAESLLTAMRRAMQVEG